MGALDKILSTLLRDKIAASKKKKAIVITITSEDFVHEKGCCVEPTLEEIILRKIYPYEQENYISIEIYAEYNNVSYSPKTYVILYF
jgi:hypothetical protein